MSADSLIHKLNWRFPYPSRRSPVFARNLVATSQPLAAQAGLAVLAQGGNAVDAALTTAITLTVVEPTSNGLGSDAFALIWDGSRLHGFNGSGRSPRGWSREYFDRYGAIPGEGWDAITVPGAVDAWARIWEQFGRLEFGRLFEPAISYARNGFPVSPIIAAAWKESADRLGRFSDFAKTFLPDGRAPRPGERFACPDLADSLERIAASKGASFYQGELADQIVACAKKAGGAMRHDDLADHQGDWTDRICVNYGDLRVHEIPPNGQGLAALIALGILDCLDLAQYPVDSAESVHLQIEAMKIAFAIAHAQISDPRFMEVYPEELLAPDFLARKARSIRMGRAANFPLRLLSEPGTVYLTAADANGMMVSFIQSNYMGFGSGVVIPATGISMHNRGCGFTLQKGHPNCVAGGKKPYHTIIPGFVTHGKQPAMSFGVMGAHMQPQGHVQMITRIFDYRQNPQAASDAPRWHVCEDGTLALESGFSPEVKDRLTDWGHQVGDQDPRWGYGGAQLICCLKDGYCGASDHRKDGCALGF